LSIENLKTSFATYSGTVKAVDGVSIQVNESEIIGVVGESGCGKSVTMLSILQLIPAPSGKISGGKVIFENQDLLEFRSDSRAMDSIRGAKISIIFQEPMTSLNPTLTIHFQLTEMLKRHLNMDGKSARERAIELLKMVGIADAETRLNDYPHQLSGGMRQRVMIAIAMSCNPRILIADEPTTALDVTTQAQLLELLKSTVTKLGSSLIIVTHNLGIVARYAERIYVMYAGKVLESGLSEEIFENPRHPYTIGLLKSVPRIDEKKGRKLVPIQGMPPSLIDILPTCGFLPRCNYRTPYCEKNDWPELREAGRDHYVRCHLDIKDAL
jgi:peptide/nickel transport system ATP-binding protein